MTAQSARPIPDFAKMPRTLKGQREFLKALEAEERAHQQAQLDAAALDDSLPVSAGAIQSDIEARREGRTRRHPVGDVGILYRVAVIGLAGYTQFTYDHRAALKKAARLRMRGYPVVITECTFQDVKTWRHA